MMIKRAVLCGIILACASVPTHAQSVQTPQEKPAAELSGCVDRQKAQNYVSAHNFAELLRAEGSDGRTYAVWTNGSQILMVNYVKPPEPKAEDFKICVVALASKVTFSLEVIEKLIESAAGTAKK